MGRSAYKLESRAALSQCRSAATKVTPCLGISCQRAQDSVLVTPSSEADWPQLALKMSDSAHDGKRFSLLIPAASRHQLICGNQQLGRALCRLGRDTELWRSQSHAQPRVRSLCPLCDCALLVTLCDVTDTVCAYEDAQPYRLLS